MTQAPTRPPTMQAPSRQASRAITQPTSSNAATLGALKPLFNPRIVLNAVEGWGKTSACCWAESPAILCAAGETGYQTLLGAGLVPEIPGAIISDWQQLLATLTDLTDGGPQTIILDAAGGFEMMCHKYVCDRDFGGDAGPTGFLNFHKGFEISAREWGNMLARLDALHAGGKTIVLLVHTTDKTVNNPMGADYCKYIGAMHQKLWDVTKRWADAVLFGKFRTVIDADAKRLEAAKRTGAKLKAIGGADRVLYCEHRDAYDAKNRYGMPAEIEIPDEPSKVWATITDNMKNTSKENR
jgi:hypothetical protein